MPAVPLTIAQIRAGLRSGYSLDPADQFTFSIPDADSFWETTAGNYTGSNQQPFSGYSVLNATQAANFRLALATWDELIAPNFTEVADTPSAHGEVRIAFTSNQMSPGTAGYAFQGSNQTPTSIVGDIWLNSSDTGQTYARGSNDFSTMIHEMGHVLGLKHPFEPTVIPDPYETTRYTIMSYTEAGRHVTFGGGGSSISSSSVAVAIATPMVLDIAAVQDLYGADLTTRTGNTTYTFNQNDAFLQSIYDAGGTDTWDLSSITRANIVDLEDGAYSSIGYFPVSEQAAYWKQFYNSGLHSFIDTQLSPSDTYTWTNNVGIAFGTVIENVLGGSGADTITGNTAANTLRGNGGNDTLNGGVGFDTAVFSGTSGSYNWTIGGPTQISGPDGTDTLINIQRMQFSNATYDFRSTGFNSPALATAAFGASPAAGGWSSNTTYPRLAADVDGNGRPDLIGFGDGGVYVALSTGTMQYGTAFLSLAGFGAGASAGGWSNNNLYPRSLADINGDGKADVVGFGDGGVTAALATSGGSFGTAFTALAGFGAGASAGSWTNNDLYPRMFADVNGDGLDDVVGFGDGGVTVALATGGGAFGAAFLATAGFGAGASAGSWTSNDVYTRTLADVNNDGRADVIGFGSGGVYVALAREDGTFNNASFAFAGFGASAAAGGWTSNNTYFRTVGDINGDGSADLVGFGDGGVHIAYGNGAGGFTTGGVVLAGFGAGASAGSWTSSNLYPRQLADLNNDGADDILGFGDGGVIAATNDTDWILV